MIIRESWAFAEGCEKARTAEKEQQAAGGDNEGEKIVYDLRHTSAEISTCEVLVRFLSEPSLPTLHCGAAAAGPVEARSTNFRLNDNFCQVIGVSLNLFNHCLGGNFSHAC